MNLQEMLLSLEEQFWKGDRAFYENNLTGEALMVFADPVGVLAREATIASIGEGARWADVQFDDVRALSLTPDVAIITYRATARRHGDSSEYHARATSVYLQRDGTWELALHQQTAQA